MLSSCLWLTRTSDGKTPDEQTKQILQIATILPGQEVDKRFSIPSRKSTMSVTENAAPAAPAPTEGEKDEPTKSEDAKPSEPPSADDTYLLTGDLSKLKVDDDARKKAGIISRMDSQTNEMEMFSDAQS